MEGGEEMADGGMGRGKVERNVAAARMKVRKRFRQSIMFNKKRGKRKQISIKKRDVKFSFGCNARFLCPSKRFIILILPLRF